MAEAMTTETVHLDRRGRVAHLVLDRPPLNVLDLATLAQLEEAARELRAQDDLHVVVVRGAGGRAFSAGVAIEDHTGEKIASMLGRFHAALLQIYQLDAVTIAAVDGHCLGGGMELAAVCDLVIASERSRFGQPEIHLGCYPPLAAALYPSLLGPAATADLLLTGRTLDCAEAERLGFVARRVVPERFESELEGLVEELLKKSGAVLRLTKKAIRAGRGNRFQKALGECEHVYLQELAATHDMEEGVRAFLEKRPPSWRHR